MNAPGRLEVKFRRWAKRGAIVIALGATVFISVIFMAWKSQLRDIRRELDAYSKAEGLAVARLFLYDLAADDRIKRLGILEQNLQEEGGQHETKEVSGRLRELVLNNIDLPDSRIWSMARAMGWNVSLAAVGAARCALYRGAIRENVASLEDDLEARVTFSDHLRGVRLKSDGGLIVVKVGEAIPSAGDKAGGGTTVMVPPTKMVVRLPLYVNIHRWGVAYFLMDRSDLIRARSAIAATLNWGLLGISMLFFVILAAWTGSWALALRGFRRKVVGPIVKLAGRMEEWEAETPRKQPDVDEPEWLAAAFERMLLRVEAQREQLLRAQRLGLMEKMGSGLSHELNNALNPAILRLDEIAIEKRDATTGDLHAIREYLSAAGRILKELSLLGRTSPGPKRRLAPDDWLGVAVRLVEPQCKKQKVKVHWENHGGSPLVNGGEQSLVEIAVNLLLNASDASKPPGGGNVYLRLERKSNGVLLVVEDDGMGIPAEVRDTLFEPFVTTKATGTGLGLFLVDSILRKMGGAIHVMERKPRGTIVEVLFPYADKATGGETGNG